MHKIIANFFHKNIIIIKMSAGEYLGFIYPGIILLYGIFWMFRKYICTRSFDVQKQGVDGVTWRPNPRDFGPQHHEPYIIQPPSNPYVPCHLSINFPSDSQFQHSAPIMAQPSAPEPDNIEIAPIHESRLPPSGPGTTANLELDPPPPYPGSHPRVCLNIVFDITPISSLLYFKISTTKYFHCRFQSIINTECK